MNVTGTALRRALGVVLSSGTSRWPLPRAGVSGLVVSAGMRRFDRLFDLIVGGFGILYALQTFDSLVADAPSLAHPLGVVVASLVGLAVLVGLGPLIAPSRSGLLFLLGAAFYGAALLLWTWTVTPPVSTDPMPWLIAIWPVGAAYLARGARTRAVPIAIATVFSTVASLGLRFRGDVAASDVAVDSLFMTGLAVVLVLLLGTVRERVVAAARTQQQAVDDFASAQLEDATEQERRRTDALLNDAVLTTFLSAASAGDPESEDLASRMAANSLRVLMHVNAVGRTEEVLPFGQALAQRCEQLGIWLSHFDQDLTAAEVVMLPEEVADALVGMLVQSLANSVRHADGATRRIVRAHPLGHDGIRIIIEDDGCGFDAGMLHQQGGGRGSESARALRALDGRVDIDTAPGAGARLVLSWGSVAIVGTDLLIDEERRVHP